MQEDSEWNNMYVDHVVMCTIPLRVIQIMELRQELPLLICPKIGFALFVVRPKVISSRPSSLIRSL